MTFDVVLLSIVYGTIGSIIATYLVRALDKHKNNRHGK